MRLVPLNGRRQTVVEFDLTLPAPFTLNPGAVHCVSPVMTRTVPDECDQRLRFSKQLQNRADNIKIGFFLSAADVVDLAGDSALEGHPYGTRMLIRKDPFADIHAVAI